MSNSGKLCHCGSRLTRGTCPACSPVKSDSVVKRRSQKQVDHDKAVYVARCSVWSKLNDYERDRLTRLDRFGLNAISVTDREWMLALLDEYDVARPPENLVSAGLVPKEREAVGLAPVLRRLALEPPIKGRAQRWRER